MKEPPNFLEQWKHPSSMRQIKLLCSFNGTFQKRSQWPGKLRYVGGESRILALERNIGISRLLSRIAELGPMCHSFSIKYQLPQPDCSGEQPLVSVDTDEDVLWMIEEHERLLAEGINARIRVFVCDARYSNRNAKKASSTGYSVRTDGLSGNPQCRVRNYRVGPVNIKNHKSMSHNVQTSQNGLYDGGNMWFNLSHGKQCLNCYSAWLGPKSGVKKVGQARPSKGSPSLLDFESGRGILPDEILQPNNESGLSNHFCTWFDLQEKDYRDPPPHKSSFHNHGAPCNFLKPEECSISRSCNTVERLDPCFRANTMWNDLPCSELTNHETYCGSKCNYPLHAASLLTRTSEEHKEVHVIELNQKNNFAALISSFSCNDPGLNHSSKLIKYPCEDQKIQMSCTVVNADEAVKELRCANNQLSLDLSMKNLSLSSVEITYSMSSPPRGCNASISLLEDLFLRSRVEGGSDLLDDEPPCLVSTAKFVSPVNTTSSRTSMIVEHQESDKETGSSCLNADEKANEKRLHCTPNIEADACCNFAHLATQELQTIKNSDLEEIKELGSGTYGTVFYGKWRGSDVAIKRIKPSCFTGGELEGKNRLIADFWKEAILLGQLRHPNVVAFYGVVSEGPVINLATVMEYMVNGSLRQVLQKKDRTIDRRKRIIIAMGAAFGMEYLHEKNIIHFDLKSHNFLVNTRDPQRPVCKIGDLGLSKVKRGTLVSGGVRGTIQWMAPELMMAKSCSVTEKIDVYSFGIVMWELLTGDEPYSNMRSRDILAGVLKGDLRPEIPNWCDPLWRSLMERCWSSDPNSRPSFSEIAKELRSMAAAANIK
ncbi:uncharacterized protein [Aristolochia californica]|uniref:uncharacterized protein n=1 Tax=Aristolochia californica TaxID=171875 RepID=UPI0035DBB6AD